MRLWQTMRRISESNDALACFDASIDANLEGKLLWLLFIVVVAFACAVFAVAREL
jgi:hypothetical protein